MITLNKRIILLISIALLSGCQQESSHSATIGIIEPLEHKAMTEIVAGFTETLSRLYQKPVTIKVENAQNDPNLQRAIVQKMRDANYTLIVPIGVAATQMAVSMAHDQSIISLAADLTTADREKLHPCHLAVVHDEVPVKQMIQFIHAVYPALTHLTLVHSFADKVFPEVKQAIAAGKEYGITVDHVMVATLPELYNVSQSLPDKTQGIFILKDNLMVSGIGTLAKTAAARHIPLITSDQGSVQDGAGFALGVHEKEIGIEGAKLAAAVLNGKNACELPIVDMKNLTVFINQKSIQEEGQDEKVILKAAQSLHYKTENSF